MPSTRRFALLSLVVIVTFASLFAAVTPRQVEAAGCTDGVQNSGAKYRICMPDNWNRKLVVFAHGFVAPQLPVEIPEDQLELPDGTSVPVVINGLGYAFATTSYSKNGLAILQGVDDVKDLVRIFERRHGESRQTFIVGPSEGGLVTALAVERHAAVFDGGVAACGPVGDFPRQINYFGDVRIIFDYYFPDLLPGTAADIPDELVDDWEAVYEPAIIDALSDEPETVRLIQRITGMPRQLQDQPESNIEAVTGALWYNVHATEDAIDVLGGLPFDNIGRFYRGSGDDAALNAGVERFAAAPAAVREMRKYQTSGRLSKPLVTLHTTRDPIVPYFHEDLFRAKVRPSHLHRNIPVYRDGHCNFEVVDALAAFGLLQLMAGPAVADRPVFGAPTRD